MPSKTVDSSLRLYSDDNDKYGGKNLNKQQLASKIWESANKMRSKIEANEYKDYILGFIFYKFLSDKQVRYLKDNDWKDEDLPQVTEDDTETVLDVQRNIGYFISYENLFSTWIKMGSDFSADNVTVALAAFNRLINSTHRKVFSGVFTTLETGLSKLGDTSGVRTRAIRDLIYLIKDIPMDGRQDYDVLGFIYEYLISNFAANAGKKAGEFYTPHEVSLLMSQIVAHHLKDRKEIKIYDPTSGSGSLLINIGNCAARYMGNGDNIKYYAQELKENTYNLTRMNLVMRGILPDNIVTRNGDTLEEDWPYFDENDPIHTYEPLYVDAVVSNPPYSQPWNPQGKEADPRFARFGLAPKGKADYAFLLHNLFHLKPDGIMTIVLPHGVLFRGGEEGTIRKNLIEQNHIDSIIGLPANIFYGTGIPTIVMILKQKRSDTDVLIIDASKGFEKVGKNNVLRACDIKKIVDVVTNRENIEKFSRVVSRDEIRANDYNLNIPRYVDSSERAESWDIYASMFGGVPESELAELHEYWEAMPGLKEALFLCDNEAYCSLKTQDIKGTIADHADAQAFIEKYKAAFDGFSEYLETRLIGGMTTLNTALEESILSDEVFSRLAGVPLIDKYSAYQLLDDEWEKISVDLEVIQTEGFAATKQVDPNMVVKKKDGKEQEVQEGWKGHVLHFELVQKTLLAGELSKLKEKEARISEISGEYSALIDELGEDDKDKDFINAEKEEFIAAEVKKALKAQEEDIETLVVLKKADDLLTEEKALKKQIKDDGAKLHILTKNTIESLSDEGVIDLLKLKWIVPLIQNLAGLPDVVLANFASKLETLCKKYETTLAGLESEIEAEERSLIEMLGDLTGNEFDMKGIEELRLLLGGERIG